MAQPVADSSSHQYRTRFYTRYLVSAGGLFLFGLFLLLVTLFGLFVEPPGFSDWKMILGTGFMGVLCLGVAIMGPFGESRTSLITSPEGIEYQGFGFRVFSRWEDIERLDVISPGQYSLAPNHVAAAKMIREKAPLFVKLEKQVPENHMECLVLRTPLRYEKRRWARGLIRSETQYIPLSEFPWWRYGALGQDIQRSAPHLFNVEQG